MKLQKTGLKMSLCLIPFEAFCSSPSTTAICVNSLELDEKGQGGRESAEANKQRPDRPESDSEVEITADLKGWPRPSELGVFGSVLQWSHVQMPSSCRWWRRHLPDGVDSPS